MRAEQIGDAATESSGDGVVGLGVDATITGDGPVAHEQTVGDGNDRRASTCDGATEGPPMALQSAVRTNGLVAGECTAADIDAGKDLCEQAAAYTTAALRAADGSIV